MTHRSRFRRLSQYAAAGTVSLVAACATDSSLTAPDESGAVMSAADAIAAVQAGPPQYVPGELLVQFRNGATTAGRGRALGRVAGQVAEEILTGPMRAQGRRVGVTRVKVSGDVQRAIAALRADENVEYAEPNWIYQHQATSNDTYYTNGSLWGMSAGGNTFGSGAATAWAANKTGSASVYVGIIDEGYMYTHEDLAANAGVNPGETDNDGIDNDGNGLVDDVYGWDFASDDKTVFDGTGDDHGTHVAGTIGGVGGNGKGVAGVVWNVKLLNAKFLGSRGGTTANAIKSVDYFTDLKTRHGLNIVATNNSWGGGGFSEALYDAIARANAAGVLFIAAAGNSTVNCDTGSCFPAEYGASQTVNGKSFVELANVIAVASITSNGAISSFSNFGATTIDIGAPGSSIWSTVPKSSKGKVIAGYASYSGTSMATPHVAGAAALYASTHAGATAAQIKAAILGSATPTSSLSGKTVTGGRLNVSGF